MIFVEILLKGMVAFGIYVTMSMCSFNILINKQAVCIKWKRNIWGIIFLCYRHKRDHLLKTILDMRTFFEKRAMH